MARGRGDVLQLRVELEGIAPPVWRRLLVSDRATLLELHDVIQAAFQQPDHAMHQFRLDGITWHDPEGADPAAPTSTGATTLDMLDLGAGARMLHEAEGGMARWRHVITVEERAARFVGQRIPACTAAGGASPPEGIDSPDRYRAMLAAIGQPGHELHDWLPEDFDAGYADLNAINAALGEVPRS